MAYARLQEEKILDSCRNTYRSAISASSSLASRTPSAPSVPPLLPTPACNPSPSIPFKRLTPEELAVRREKGLCFHCDEKYSRGHKCASSLFLLVTDDEELQLDSIQSHPPSPSHDLLPEPPPAQLSLHALSGHLAPETLRMTDIIEDQPINILIDGDNTHNFLHHRMVLTLGLSPTETTPFRVTVGNGDELRCHQLCQAVTVQIQDHSFTINFHILPLCDADVVLGVQWLKTLGPVLTDYTTLTMKFITVGKLIELHRDREKDFELVLPSQLRRLLHTNTSCTFFHIRLDPPTTSESTVESTPSAITQFTTKYADLFQPLNTLPPSRPTNHTITLLPNSTPMNVRPYRYPYF